MVKICSIFAMICVAKLYGASPKNAHDEWEVVAPAGVSTAGSIRSFDDLSSPTHKGRPAEQTLQPSEKQEPSPGPAFVADAPSLKSPSSQTSTSISSTNPLSSVRKQNKNARNLTIDIPQQDFPDMAAANIATPPAARGIWAKMLRITGSIIYYLDLRNWLNGIIASTLSYFP
jgi:hypothetical protein